MAIEKNLQFYQGDDEEFRIVGRNTDTGIVESLAGNDFWLTIMTDAAQPDSSAVLQLTLVNGATVRNVTAGPLRIGRRYTFATVVAGDDFENVGSDADPSPGDSFVCIATTPTVWTNGSVLTEATGAQFYPWIQGETQIADGVVLFRFDPAATGIAEGYGIQLGQNYFYDLQRRTTTGKIKTEFFGKVSLLRPQVTKAF
ncbi:MAG: hypothetical protein ABQ298_03805 [Puniceicoccaceae bacterium]